MSLSCHQITSCTSKALAIDPVGDFHSHELVVHEHCHELLSAMAERSAIVPLKSRTAPLSVWQSTTETKDSYEMAPTVSGALPFIKHVLFALHIKKSWGHGCACGEPGRTVGQINANKPPVPGSDLVKVTALA